MPRSFLLFGASLMLASMGAAATSYPSCSFVLVDIKASEEIYKNLPANATPEQLQALAAKAVRVLGEFKPEVGEEATTTKSYPLPGSSLIATGSVFFTDEAIPGDQASVALVVAKNGVDNAFRADDSAVAATSFTDFTYQLAVRRQLSIGSRLYSLKLECIFFSAAEYREKAQQLVDLSRPQEVKQPKPEKKQP